MREINAIRKCCEAENSKIHILKPIKIQILIKKAPKMYHASFYVLHGWMDEG